MNHSTSSADVIIIGGGPAGAAAAITLASRGLLVVIIERSNYSMVRIGETLPPSIRHILIDLGVWNLFQSGDHNKSFTIRSAWGSHILQDNPHIYNPYGSGWHINRTRFDEMLMEGATNAGAIVFNNSRIINLSHNHNSKWSIVIQQPKGLHRICAPFLIDATGRAGAIAVNLPRSSHVIDRLIGIVRFFRQVNELYMLIEAEAGGWWYSAPLPGGLLVVAYMTDADILSESNLKPYDYWTHNLSNAPLTVKRLGLQAPFDSKIVSAASMLRKPLCGSDWIAIGDASMALDPLSGQGIFNALSSGIHGAESVIDRINGSKETFIDYSGWVNNQFLTYLKTRNLFYSKELRWPSSKFWSRRQNSDINYYT